MFTGLIEDVGRIERMESSGGAARVTVSVERIDTQDLQLGESIAVNGVCFTVIAWDARSFTFEASDETLARTTLRDLIPGTRVHLERALAVGARLGGHIVQGHVDGVGKLLSNTAAGGARELWLWAPRPVARLLVEKGSIAIDGVSLTVNEVHGERFRVTIVPHTSGMTLLTDLTPGARVNLESDIVGKYVARLVRGYARPEGEDDEVPRDPEAPPGPRSLRDLLIAQGFMSPDDEPA